MFWTIDSCIRSCTCLFVAHQSIRVRPSQLVSHRDVKLASLDGKGFRIGIGQYCGFISITCTSVTIDQANHTSRTPPVESRNIRQGSQLAPVLTISENTHATYSEISPAHPRPVTPLRRTNLRLLGQCFLQYVCIPLPPRPPQVAPLALVPWSLFFLFI